VRLRICRPLRGSIDGVGIDHFQVGLTYEIGTQVASVLLAEGWAVPASAVESADPLRPSPKRTRALVLVVDDESVMRHLVADLLAWHGYDVVLAQHGYEGLQRLCEHCPNLVVLDLNMPVMDGWEFRAAQRRLADPQLVNIPVLLLTSADPADARAAALDAVGRIEKPFDPDRLLSAIRMALRAA
jgi:CheY-like chemotaxis protein